MADPSKEQEAAAREQVMKSEQVIQSIKAALRRLGTAENADAPNSIEICMLKVEGLPEGAKPILNLQLSSPIEEATLSEIYDPLNADPAPEGSLATFEGVEISVATLVVTAKDADIPLGSSEPQNLAPLCVLDAMEVKEKYVSELLVAIVPDGTPAEVVVASVDDKPDTPSGEKEDETKGSEEEKTEEAQAEGETEAEPEAKSNDDAAEETPKVEEAVGEVEAQTEPLEASAEVIQPICTVTLRITYKPSPKDQREELYELLNKTSQKKAAALENLRKISMAMAKSGEAASRNKDSSSAVTKPAVKAGFLNKKKKEPTTMEKIYEKTIGPNSLLMKGYGIALFAKNYIIFFGAVTFFHFKGQLLALPPPA